MDTLTKPGALAPVTPGGAVVATTRAWLDGIEKATTRRSYTVSLRDFAGWLGNEVVGEPFELDRLPVNVSEFLSARTLRKYISHKEHQGAARATINHRLSAVRKWTRALEDAELIHPHRAEAVYHVKGVRGQNRSHRSYLTEQEVQTVLDSIGREKLIDIRDRALFGLLAWNGLRRAEVCSLRLGQYQSVNGHKIIDGIERKGHDLDWVKVAVPVQRALEAWWQAAGLSDPHAPMFCAVDKGSRASGEPLSPNAVYLMVKRRTKAAGFEQITPHSLRRSMATALDARGCPVSLIQAAGGWKSRAMLDVYIQQSVSLDRNATDFLHIVV